MSIESVSRGYGDAFREAVVRLSLPTMGKFRPTCVVQVQ